MNNKTCVIHDSIAELIGGTPHVRLNKIAAGTGCELIAKLEAFNPGGSVKDRIAYSMIVRAEEEGKISPDTVLIEPTSGNTGIGLAWVAAAKGYRLKLTMPETMSRERRALLKALGAELVLTPGSEGMQGAIDKARELADELHDACILQQFENEANPRIHEETTGPEIWEATAGNIDMLVCGVGTGGTLTGAGKYLKSKREAVQIVAVEPASSAVISGKEPGPHQIQGIGAGFIPGVLDTDLIDSVVTVGDHEAMGMARRLAREEGVLGGISSGAALFAALKLAQKPANRGKNIVVVLPDTGERYLTTELFSSL